MKKECLKIEDLYVTVGNEKIIDGLNLTIYEEEKHILMGPNGSGKSTLVKAILGSSECKIIRGKITYKGEDILSLSPDEKSKLGIFASFQHPTEITGVNNLLFLRFIYNLRNEALSKEEFEKFLDEKMEMLKIDKSFKYRNINEGFSGGEKKKNEILQMLIINPSFAIFDEIDSGVDIDSLKLIFSIIAKKKEQSCLLITHYPNILDYINPDFVHVMSKGKIIKTGDRKFASCIEEKGFEAIFQEMM